MADGWFGRAGSSLWTAHERSCAHPKAAQSALSSHLRRGFFEHAISDAHVMCTAAQLYHLSGALCLPTFREWTDAALPSASAPTNCCEAFHTSFSQVKSSQDLLQTLRQLIALCASLNRLSEGRPLSSRTSWTCATCRAASAESFCSRQDRNKTVNLALSNVLRKLDLNLNLNLMSTGSM